MIIRQRDHAPTRIARRGQRHRTVREIGYGTFGKILEIETRDGRYALKTFTFANDNYHLTTIREIKAMRAISSPYVLEIEAIIEEGGKFHLLFEHFPNDLYKIIGSENFTIDDIRHVFWQILKGVEAIHEKGYLHRDLKTANILIKRISSTISDNGSENLNKDQKNDSHSPERHGEREEFREGQSREQPVYQNTDARDYSDRRLPQFDEDSATMYNNNQDLVLRNDYESYSNNVWRKDNNHITFGDQEPNKEDHCGGQTNTYQTPSKVSEIVKRDCSADTQNAKKRCTQHSPPPVLHSRNDEQYPHNISNYRIKICDFGMSRTKSKEMTPGVVTLWYRSPELLLGSSTYSKPVDIWSLGCILLEFFKKKPLFKANTEVEELDAIIELCGAISEESMAGCANLPLYEKYNLKKGERKILETFASFCAQAADLADRMLSLDPSKRPSIIECLNHPFFQKSD